MTTLRLSQAEAALFLKEQAIGRKKAYKRKSLSEGEEAFASQLQVEGINGFEREYRFHPERRWRFDFANPGLKLAVEVEGGVFQHGRHTRGSGFEKDAEKYNAAAMDGWMVLRYSTQQVKKGYAIRDVKRIINSEVS